MMNQKNEPLLIVEDSDEDFEAIERLMRRIPVSNPIYRCTDGDQILDWLAQSDPSLSESPIVLFDSNIDLPRPSVILLDLNLPGTDGREVLAQLKQNQEMKEIPVVVYTTSDDPHDIEFCYRSGANGYLVKPLDRQALKKLIQSFVDYWLDSNTPPPTWKVETLEG
ncbi:MAG: response regulator [Synechococcales bacterium]|nr:response regulator [Synechococcales bacterium]